MLTYVSRVVSWSRTCLILALQAPAPAQGKRCMVEKTRSVPDSPLYLRSVDSALIALHCVILVFTLDEAKSENDEVLDGL